MGELTIFQDVIMGSIIVGIGVAWGQIRTAVQSAREVGQNITGSLADLSASMGRLAGHVEYLAKTAERHQAELDQKVDVRACDIRHGGGNQ